MFGCIVGYGVHLALGRIVPPTGVMVPSGTHVRDLRLPNGRSTDEGSGEGEEVGVSTTHGVLEGSLVTDRVGYR